jgi:5-methylcytosine-specific restriction endonuclease McrA
MKEYERDRSTRRRKATDGTYKTKMWLRRREAVMARDGWICRDGRVCAGNAIAEEVDHIIPLDQGGDRYAMSNLRATCRRCHQAKTAEENRRAGVGKVADAVSSR